MSRWPTDYRVKRSASDLGLQWQRLRGRVPRHVIYLQQEGLWSWSVGRRTDAPGRDKTPLQPPAFFADFSDWCRLHAQADASLILSGGLVHNLVVDPALGLLGDDSIRTYARQQFAHYHGSPARQWPVAVWSSGESGVACADPGATLQMLQASASANGVNLREVVPAWCTALASMAGRVPVLAGPAQRDLVLVEGVRVTWIGIESGRVRSLEQRHLDAPRPELLAELIRAVGCDGPPQVIGWGLDDAQGAAALPAELAGVMRSAAEFGTWMVDGA